MGRYPYDRDGALGARQATTPVLKGTALAARGSDLSGFVASGSAPAAPSTPQWASTESSLASAEDPTL